MINAFLQEQTKFEGISQNLTVLLGLVSDFLISSATSVKVGEVSLSSFFVDQYVHKAWLELAAHTNLLTYPSTRKLKYTY